jgi:dipeptidyl aminopeptidase/acylaminoacyl peptidase
VTDRRVGIIGAMAGSAVAADTSSTPTLVIRGAQDQRVPDPNGLAHDSTLKARGVDARRL